MKKERRPVEDGVVIVDCGPCLRRFGLARFARCNNLWCVKDICGIICVVLTWLLVLYAEYVVMFVMLIPSPNPYYGLANAILFNFLAFMALASHSKAMLSDPVSFKTLFMCGSKRWVGTGGPDPPSPVKSKIYRVS